jgi:hypothetical protein
MTPREQAIEAMATAYAQAIGCFAVQRGHEITDAIKRLTGELETLRRDFRTLAARVERLTRLRWEGHTLMVAAIQFGSIWNGTGQYSTPGWRVVLSNCNHVGVYPTETEARAALETAAREACK